MDGIGDQLLAGTRLAVDEDRGVPFGYLAHLVEDQSHEPGVPDNTVEPMIPAYLPQ